MNMKVFGRETTKAHGKLALVCAEIFGQGNRSPNDDGFAWNLIHEQRVNEDWAEYWYQQAEKPISAEQLNNSITKYQTKLRAEPLDSYADIESRGRMFVNLFGPAAPDPADLLVQVLDLWSPATQVIWKHGFHRGIGLLSDLGKASDFLQPKPPPAFVTIWKTGTVDGQMELMESFFTAWSLYLEEVEDHRRRRVAMDTLNPHWVTLWKPWNERVGISGDEYCESVGLSKSVRQTPTWSAVIRYPARRAKRLICPTQLEGGWFGRHFPTPPECDKNGGGRVVDGRSDLASQPEYRPLPEYIHAPIPLRISDWIDAGFPVVPTSRPIGDPTHLKRDRETHWRALRNQFADVERWMERANP